MEHKYLVSPKAPAHLSSYSATRANSDKFRPAETRNVECRCITKSGKIEFGANDIDLHNWITLEDIFTILLENKWRWTLLALCLGYFGSWAFFAFCYYGILWQHGDIHNFETPGWKPCITGLSSFASVFLFSVETQHTIGYGYYHLSDECSLAGITLCIQSIVGVVLEGLLVGLVFVKLARRRKLQPKLMFSRNAVISQRDGKFCFMFRVGNANSKVNLLDSNIRAQIIRTKTTREGEVINFFQEELLVSGNNGKPGSILLFWPTTIIHQIDKNSPLYNFSPANLTFSKENNFEIIVVLEGIAESTGLRVQTRTSYLPSEILWGYQFKELQTIKCGSSGERVLDYSRFHESRSVVTSFLSASELDTYIEIV